MLVLEQYALLFSWKQPRTATVRSAAWAATYGPVVARLKNTKGQNKVKYWNYFFFSSWSPLNWIVSRFHSNSNLKFPTWWKNKCYDVPFSLFYYLNFMNSNQIKCKRGKSLCQHKENKSPKYRRVSVNIFGHIQCNDLSPITAVCKIPFQIYDVHPHFLLGLPNKKTFLPAQPT